MVTKVTIAPQGPDFSELVQGYWRLAEWGMTPQQRLTFLKQHIDLGITTVDHADIYGGYQCEKLFGEALALDPSVREQIQIVTKCDINLCGDHTPDRKINHYDTSAQHIYQSVNNSLEQLGVDEIDVLLIHRPDVLMDADEVAEDIEAMADLAAQVLADAEGDYLCTLTGFGVVGRKPDARAAVPASDEWVAARATAAFERLVELAGRADPSWR